MGIKHDDLEQATGGISANQQYAVLSLANQAQRDADRGLDVLVGDSVPSSTVRDLQS